MAAAAAVGAVQPQQLLGADGRGYELARRLDSCGAWRAWLGDFAYAAFAHSLASPAAWEAFMRSDAAAAKSRSQILLQLRARALLFDKASISLFSDGPSPAPSLSNINPTYLQLHADDVYFPLEDGPQDAVPRRGGSAAAPSRMPQPTAQARAALSFHYDRNPSSGNEHIALRTKQEELPETWYSQCADKLKKGKPPRSPPGDREPHKRTSEGMSAYIKHVEVHKRKRRLLADEPRAWENGGSRNPQKISQDVSSSMEDDTCLLPETMFPANCVPESALPPLRRTREKNQKVDVTGVLDSLPNLICQNPAAVERFGIRPEFVKVELGRNKFRGKNGSEGLKKLSPEQASLTSQKTIARVLAGVGLEGGTQVTMEVLSKFMAAHVCKLGRTLKILSDSYRRQCSSAELLKMFARTAGISFAAVADHMRDTAKLVSLQNQQHVNPNYLHQQQANPIQRPVHPQLNASFVFQQQQQQHQLQQLRRRQASLPRVGSMPMGEVKTENSTDAAADARQPPQYRPQQMPAIGQQFRPMAGVGQASAPAPRLQSQNSFGPRAAPVKVEGFEELMGAGGSGDPAQKHDAEHRFTSPSK